MAAFLFVELVDGAAKKSAEKSQGGETLMHHSQEDIHRKVREEMKEARERREAAELIQREKRESGARF